MIRASGVAKCLTGVASIGCLVTAVVVLALGTEQLHEQKAEAFEQSVAAWVTERPSFDGLHVTTRFIQHDGTWGHEVRLKRYLEENVDLSMEETAQDLSRYEPLSYRVQGVPTAFQPPVSYATLNWEVGDLSWERIGAMIRVNITIADTQLQTMEMPLVKAVAHREQKGGYHHCHDHTISRTGGMCWVYERVTRICLQVEMQGTSWRFASRRLGANDSYGCEHRRGEWSIARYDTAPFPFSSSGEQLVPHGGFEGLEIVLRSAHDPYLTALELTNGTLDFGMSVSEVKWLAGVLFVMAFMLAVPPACSIGMWWHKSRQQSRRSQIRLQAGSSRGKRHPSPETLGMKYATGYDDPEDNG